MTFTRRLLFGLIAATLATGATLGVLLAADLWAHHRAERTAGVNRRGYRGAVVGSPRDGEWRLAMLGGSTVFGYGVFASESLPAQLEQRLRARGSSASVVNLGFNSEGAYAFAPTIRDYASLHPGVVILYEGYNDLLPDEPNRLLARHGSFVFRTTGYFPILPVVLRDKADAVARGNGGSRTVFGVAAGAVDALTRQVGRLTPGDAAAAGATTRATPHRWDFYCDAVVSAVKVARAQGSKVLVVSQPYISDSHVEQQQALRAALRAFAADPDVAYLDAGREIDLKNTQLAFDGMHLTPEGNRHMADVVAAALQPLETSRSR